MGHCSWKKFQLLDAKSAFKKQKLDLCFIRGEEMLLIAFFPPKVEF